jgi:mRNA interferase RelE/StbE
MQGDHRLWRYRIGDYRMIAEIENQIVTITIIKIGHRREVYR